MDKNAKLKITLTPNDEIENLEFQLEEKKNGRPLQTTNKIAIRDDEEQPLKKGKMVYIFDGKFSYF